MNQLSHALAERSQLVPEYKFAKQKNKTIKWINEKLILEGKIKDVKRDDIKDVNSMVPWPE